MSLGGAHPGVGRRGVWPEGHEREEGSVNRRGGVGGNGGEQKEEEEYLSAWSGGEACGGGGGGLHTILSDPRATFLGLAIITSISLQFTSY